MKMKEIDINKVSPNPNQPRKDFDADKMLSLANNIKDNELIQPITVREFNGGYQVIVGERRYRAYKQLNKKNIPCIIKNVTDIQALELSMIENAQREDLSFIEKENAIKSLWDTDKYENYNILYEKTGIPTHIISRCLSAYIIRKELKPEVGIKLSSETIASTKSLKPKVRKKVLQEVAKKHIQTNKVNDTVKVLKQFKEPEQQLEVIDDIADATDTAEAIIKHKVEHKHHIATGEAPPDFDYTDIHGNFLNGVHDALKGIYGYGATTFNSLPINRRDEAYDEFIKAFLYTLSQLIKGDKMDRVEGVFNGEVTLKCKDKYTEDIPIINDATKEWFEKRYKK